MKVSFTGTRKGMTLDQQRQVKAFLIEHYTKITALHHGDCEGADSQFHEFCLAFGLDDKIHVHPSTHKTRAYNKGGRYIYPAKRPQDRDKDIVQACTVLLAAPHTRHEIVRSGTWMTVRMARKLERRIELYLP